MVALDPGDLRWHTSNAAQHTPPNTLTNKGIFLFRYSTTTQCWKTETFLKEKGKASKQPNDFEYGQRVQHPFYFTTEAISNTKLPFVSKGNRFNGSGTSGYVEKRCGFNRRTSLKSVSKFNISGREQRRQEPPGYKSQ